MTVVKPPFFEPVGLLITRGTRRLLFVRLPEEESPTITEEESSIAHRIRGSISPVAKSHLVHPFERSLIVRPGGNIACAMSRDIRGAPIPQRRDKFR